jgi:hypothetical protein
MNFDVDLTSHELARRAAVLAAMGDTWDVASVMAAEQEAEEMLYANLDPHQQIIYNQLRAWNGSRP